VDDGATPEVVGTAVVGVVEEVVVDNVVVEVVVVEVVVVEVVMAGTDSAEVVVMITTGMLSGAAAAPEVVGTAVEEVEATATSAALAPPPAPPAQAVADRDVRSMINAKRGADFTRTTVQPTRRPGRSSHEPISTSVASVAG